MREDAGDAAGEASSDGLDELVGSTVGAGVRVSVGVRVGSTVGSRVGEGSESDIETADDRLSVGAVDVHASASHRRDTRMPTPALGCVGPRDTTKVTSRINSLARP